MIALYIGRFQPLHKGHYEYIEKILNENPELKIVIGSSQESNTKKNPFNAEERKEMIRNCFPHVKIFTANDYPNENEKWLSNIKKTVGKFDIVYAGENQLIRSIFFKAGYKVKTIGRINNISSTKIRNLIAKGKEWKHLVPECAYRYIKKINGEERIKNETTKS